MIPVEKAQQAVEGNAEVIDLLERWLERAKLGYLDCIALVACESPVVAFSDHAGMNTSHFSAYVALDQLKSRLATVTSPDTPHTPTPIDKHIPANRVSYDINNEPVQFDFLPWLMTVEMNRRREGVTDPLEVKFFRGRTNMIFSDQEKTSINAWMENVVIPLVRMVGGTVVDDTRPYRRSSCYSFVEIAEAARRGEEVPHLQVLPTAAEAVDHMLRADARAPVVITLREAEHWPHRNSNMDAWLPFARKLQSDGEFVLFVRDSYRHSEPIDGFATCPGASRDLDLRLALYARAKCNLFVDNGPYTMTLLTAYPWMAIINADPMTGYIPNTPQWWKRNHGVSVGEQFPWSGPHQRIVWGSDTYETMCREWEHFVSYEKKG